MDSLSLSSSFEYSIGTRGRCSTIGPSSISGMCCLRPSSCTRLIIVWSGTHTFHVRPCKRRPVSKLIKVYVPCVFPDGPRQIASTVRCFIVFVGELVSMVSCTNAPNGSFSFDASSGFLPSTMVDGLRCEDTPLLEGNAFNIRVTNSASAITITRGQHDPYGKVCHMHRIRSFRTLMWFSMSPTCSPAAARLTWIGATASMMGWNSLSANISCTSKPLLSYLLMTRDVSLIIVSALRLSTGRMVINLILRDLLM